MPILSPVLLRCLAHNSVRGWSPVSKKTLAPGVHFLGHFLPETRDIPVHKVLRGLGQPPFPGGPGWQGFWNPNFPVLTRGRQIRVFFWGSPGGPGFPRRWDTGWPRDYWGGLELARNFWVGLLGGICGPGGKIWDSFRPGGGPVKKGPQFFPL